MKHSEFWEAVDRAFPDGRGLALAQDLVLPELGSRSAVEAIADMDPQEVWHALRVAMDLPDSCEYLHRKSK
ncbi:MULTISPECIES: DUF3046 domain-containing protein [Trueperella]|uniref:DUF3046 domain-containing protein n=1 Tax=Trueperella abortisuis TaxID=445930 RepID=A0ABT9PHJ1_9ACTO|nr:MULTISPECIES: DUF3046 domain-containing protein [Trueperella]MCI7305653.1 DUF3046 domain-containing protein [Trueperella sp.]MDP9832180.1 hypothetical protein [Trueperella abortisuis]MDY5402994.1 DUF3046 domain-containing protein [Trueperella sp.]